MVSTYGQMEESTKVNGKMGNNMAKENTSFWMVQSSLGYGRMERELNGFRKNVLINREAKNSLKKQSQMFKKIENNFTL